jgi:CXXX repeat peptide maturase
MLQYLIIIIDDTSTSFCHYDVPNAMNKRLIDLDDLKQGIKYAMMENLMIQFVYPDFKLPKQYTEVINSIDHIDIRPFTEKLEEKADVVVFNGLPLNILEESYPTSIFRVSLQEFFDFPPYLVKQICHSIKRTNIVISNIDPILSWDIDRYKSKLYELSDLIEQEYVNDNICQWNILTDRISLLEMNNCNAGDTTITLAPNGKLYICPAFYYENMEDSVGDVYSGLDIPNQRLYKLQFAPICRHCDAYQCKRCVWLNRRMTLEVNTPSHEQCVAAHLERNASRSFLHNLRKHGDFMSDKDISEIDYLDPFNNKDKW